MLFYLVVSMVVAALVNGQDLTCLEGWLRFQEGRTCIKAFHDVEKSWSLARQYCNDLEADLVKIDSPIIRDFVADMLFDGKFYWTGLHDENEDGTFEFVDGENLTSFQWWWCSQPNNFGGNQHCVEMMGSLRGRWNDNTCSKKGPFVCQLESPGGLEGSPEGPGGGLI